MKKILLFVFASVLAFLCSAQKNGDIALTPPMGWNSWNLVEANVSEKIICEIADSMAANGMRDAGYQYIIIDDFWVGGRDSKNRLFPDPVRFPNGMKAVADYVHSKVDLVEHVLVVHLHAGPGQREAAREMQLLLGLLAVLSLASVRPPARCQLLLGLLAVLSLASTERA